LAITCFEFEDGNEFEESDYELYKAACLVRYKEFEDKCIRAPKAEATPFPTTTTTGKQTTMSRFFAPKA
jgi:hypothetical protein